MDVSQHAVHVRIIIILTQSNYIEWSVYETSACSTERECGRSSPFSVHFSSYSPIWKWFAFGCGEALCTVFVCVFVRVCAENCNFYANFMLTTDHKLLFVEKCSCICYFYEKKMVSHLYTGCWGCIGIDQHFTSESGRVLSTVNLRRKCTRNYFGPHSTSLEKSRSRTLIWRWYLYFQH